MTTKELVLKAIEDLPDDVDIGEVVERLYFLHALEQSIREADAGELIPHEEVQRQVAEWLR